MNKTNLSKTLIVELDKMDSLNNLMSLVDGNSDIIPEGDYLKFCDHLKKIYTTLSNHKILVAKVIVLEGTERRLRLRLSDYDTKLKSVSEEKKTLEDALQKIATQRYFDRVQKEKLTERDDDITLSEIQKRLECS